MRAILLLAMVAFLLQACHSSRGFLARKYTRGVYRDQSARAFQPKNLNSAPVCAAVTASGNTPKRKENLDVPEIGASKSYEPADETVLRGKIQNGADLRAKNSETTGKGKITVASKIQGHDAADPQASDRSARVSVIISGLALVMNIVAFLATLAVSIEFSFLFIPGFALGIIGMTMGFRTIRRYSIDKMNGYKKNSNLAFGIVAASVGLAAMISAIIFAYIAVIFYLAEVI